MKPNPTLTSLLVLAVGAGCASNADRYANQGADVRVTANVETTIDSPGVTATASVSTPVLTAPSTTATAPASVTATAATTASAPASASTTAAAVPDSLPGATVNIGTSTTEGLTSKDISCIVKDGGLVGLMGSLTIVAGLSKRKSQLDACSKTKTETRVHLWQDGVKVTKVEAKHADEKVARCVEKALTGALATSQSECLATIVHGK